MEKKKAADQTPNNDKKQALDTAIRQIEKNFGKGAVMRLGDRPDLQVDAIPTGSLALDAALGIDGVPKGRIIGAAAPPSAHSLSAAPGSLRRSTAAYTPPRRPGTRRRKYAW